MNIKCSELDNVEISIDYFNSIKLIGDELIKYIRGYNQLSQEYIKKLQLFNMNSSKKLTKSENKKTSQIITFTSKMTEIISKNIEMSQSSIDNIEQKVKQLETVLKEKLDNLNNIKKSYLDLTKDLNNLCSEINKVKSNCFNSLSKTEEAMYNYYTSINKMEKSESGLHRKLSENALNMLKDLQKNQLTEMNNNIKISKKFEQTYNELASSFDKKHDKFIEEINNYRDKVKNDACDISEEIKNLVSFFMLNFNSSYQEPMQLADAFIKLLHSLDEKKETDKIINESFQNNNPLKNFTLGKYQLKSISVLKDSNFFKNEEDMENDDGDLNLNNQNKNKSNLIEILEDGFSQIIYISDEPLIMTIKSLFASFGIIDKGDFDLKFEESKNRTQKYIFKIISNMNSYPFAKEGLYINNNIDLIKDFEVEYERNELTSHEVNDLIELLKIHENRIILLQKLSDYRARGKFILCQQDFDFLSKIFNIITDQIKKDNDYHTAEMVIILSATYYIEDGKRKKYIQESIKPNKIFKDKNFWEEFLCYSINKEIMKTLNVDQKVKEDKKNSDYKYSNVVFSQILTLIDNMFEFEVDYNTIKDVLNPKISYYKLNDGLKKTIEDVIAIKQEQKDKELKEKVKLQKVESENKHNIENKEQNEDNKAEQNSE